MAVKTYPDGSWIDEDPVNPKWCLSEEVIVNEFPEYKHNALRKWNCVETDGLGTFLRIGEQQLDALGALFGGLTGTEPQLAFRDKVDPDSPYWNDPVDTAVDDLQNWLYKVLHAGYSLVFGTPMMGILTALNKKREEGDPSYRNQISFRQAIYNPLGADVDEVVYSADPADYDPITYTDNIAYESLFGGFDPVTYVSLTLEGFQEYDPI